MEAYPQRAWEIQSCIKHIHILESYHTVYIALQTLREATPLRGTASCFILRQYCSSVRTGLLVGRTMLRFSVELRKLFTLTEAVRDRDQSSLRAGHREDNPAVP